MARRGGKQKIFNIKNKFLPHTAKADDADIAFH